MGACVGVPQQGTGWPLSLPLWPTDGRPRPVQPRPVALAADWHRDRPHPGGAGALGLPCDPWTALGCWAGPRALECEGGISGQRLRRWTPTKCVPLLCPSLLSGIRKRREGAPMCLSSPREHAHTFSKCLCLCSLLSGASCAARGSPWTSVPPSSPGTWHLAPLLRKAVQWPITQEVTTLLG